MQLASHPLTAVPPCWLGFDNRQLWSTPFCSSIFSSLPLFLRRQLLSLVMAPPPGPYSGTSTLALVRSQLPFLVSFFLFSRGTHTIHSQVARASAFSFGLVYGTIKLKYLKVLYITNPSFFIYSYDLWLPFLTCNLTI